MFQRQAKESAKFPYLANDKQNKTFKMETLSKLFINTEIVGLGAYYNKQLAGYLFGIIKVDTERGRYIWIPYEGVAILLAENNSEAIGFQAYYQVESNLMIPEKGIELSVAGTYEAYMSLGVGKNLMNKAIEVLNERGYKYIISDRRITNLSSGFWKKCGFQVIAYRMYRQLDERLAWANFNNPIIKCDD